jgi:hypothetical protein
MSNFAFLQTEWSEVASEPTGAHRHYVPGEL